jgi:hypothetical protein
VLGVFPERTPGLYYLAGMRSKHQGFRTFGRDDDAIRAANTVYQQKSAESGVEAIHVVLAGFVLLIGVLYAMC